MLSDDQVTTDYLSSGTIIGEIGVLTGERRNASVSCETAVQVNYYITERASESLHDTGTTDSGG